MSQEDTDTLTANCIKNQDEFASSLVDITVRLQWPLPRVILSPPISPWQRLAISMPSDLANLKITILCISSHLSEFARGIAKADKRTWSGVIVAWNEKKKDPDAFAVNRVKHQAGFHRLMEYAVSQVDIVVGTPVALVEFAQHTEFVPQLIVVDEAARLTENLSLVLQAQWQSAFSVYISDTQQFPPIGLTVEQRDFKAVFSYQRQISLFHPSRKFHDWVQKKFTRWGCLSATLLIRPDNSEETKSGNSFSNPANANFAVQLIVQLYQAAGIVEACDFSRRASIIILTPYKAQRRMYDLLLLELTEAEVPKTLVEVRTIDDSPSHEANIIILDWRDVLRPPRVDFSGSKRVKQNSANREDVFAKPDKHKNAMRKHFCDAMRGLREAKKDQDVKEVIESDGQDQAGDDGNADEGNW
ncbi:hypothetical protein FOXB_10855 [Fusarium oxysporum f. sp. conglutinans Fo5176]|uniref:DNA2/NAM7 helicase-like C-terminal domain-containing protein n=2 Tax=Fusarium oxysporum f. sp. conglutinans TaxID=100902 RepID=F9FWS3_FUSOF|nr:hypothetical protein FOXB_10855 [Fusarium oxysporum f. sp. conglutinans Fo5176]